MVWANHGGWWNGVVSSPEEGRLLCGPHRSHPLDRARKLSCAAMGPACAHINHLLKRARNHEIFHQLPPDQATVDGIHLRAVPVWEGHSPPPGRKDTIVRAKAEI